MEEFRGNCLKVKKNSLPREGRGRVSPPLLDGQVQGLIRSLGTCLTLEKVDTIVIKNEKRERFKTKT